MARVAADGAKQDAVHFMFSFRGDASGVSETLTLTASGGGGDTDHHWQLRGERNIRCCQEHEHEDCDQPRTIVEMQLSQHQLGELAAQFLAASLFATPPKPTFDAGSSSRDYSTAVFTAHLGGRKLDVRARVSGNRHSSINLLESKPLADFLAHANALLEKSGTRTVIEPPRRAPNNEF